LNGVFVIILWVFYNAWCITVALTIKADLPIMSCGYKCKISWSQFGRYERGEDLRYASLLKVIVLSGL